MGEQDFDPEEIADGLLKEVLSVDTKFKRKKKFDHPRKVAIDLKDVHKLAAIMGTQREIAFYLGIPVRTFERRLEDTPEVREAFESGRAQFRMTLMKRMTSIALSRRRDAGTMCIWLSKQVLGMQDKLAVTASIGMEAGMSSEIKRRSMAELMGEDPNDPTTGLELDAAED